MKLQWAGGLLHLLIFYIIQELSTSCHFAVDTPGVSIPSPPGSWGSPSLPAKGQGIVSNRTL